MATVQFYHLLHTPLEAALPSLLQKVLAAGHRVLVHGHDTAQLAALSNAMWRLDGQGFLPHGQAEDGHAALQPIFLSTQFENVNGADVLVIVDGSAASEFSYTKILDLFDGRNEQAVASARVRWAAYKAQGVGLQYIQQQPSGGWKIEAEAAA